MLRRRRQKLYRRNVSVPMYPCMRRSLAQKAVVLLVLVAAGPASAATRSVPITKARAFAENAVDAVARHDMTVTEWNVNPCKRGKLGTVDCAALIARQYDDGSSETCHFTIHVHWAGLHSRRLRGETRNRTCAPGEDFPLQPGPLPSNPPSDCHRADGNC
jgi:hypothetical protein